LKHQGNASKLIDDLVAQASLETSSRPSLGETRRADSAITRVEGGAKSASQLQKESEKRQDYHVIRDKVLTSLKLGKQARI